MFLCITRTIAFDFKTSKTRPEILHPTREDGTYVDQEYK